MESSALEGTVYKSFSELVNPIPDSTHSYMISGSQNVAASGFNKISDTYARKSLWEAHHLQPDTQLKVVASRTASPEWVTFVLLAAISLIALVRNLYTKRLRVLLFAPFSNRKMGQVLRDSDNLSAGLQTWLTINYFLMASLAIFLIIKTLVTLPAALALGNGFVLYIAILIIYSILYYTKRAAATFFGHLFKEHETSYLYNLNTFLLSIPIGTLLIPILWALLFLPSEWYESTAITGLALIFILLFFKFLRTVTLSFRLKWFTLVYFFLYLCTLEILPVLLLMKAIAKLDPA